MQPVLPIISLWALEISFLRLLPFTVELLAVLNGHLDAVDEVFFVLPRGHAECVSRIGVDEYLLQPRLLPDPGQLVLVVVVGEGALDGAEAGLGRQRVPFRQRRRLLEHHG